MKLIAMAIAFIYATQAAPDELVAIRCIGSETERKTEAAKPVKRPVDIVLILNEHDRTISQWDETLGRDRPFCEVGIKTCLFDFSPANINIDSDPASDPHQIGWINRKTGKMTLLTIAGAGMNSTEAQCTKTAMPRFDPATRAF